jgi:nitronate monooxygenase
MLKTRFSSHFGFKTPIALAPMALASGGELASACARSGILGLIGGGYGELAWLRKVVVLVQYNLSTFCKISCKITK